MATAYSLTPPAPALLFSADPEDRLRVVAALLGALPVGEQASSPWETDATGLAHRVALNLGSRAVLESTWETVAAAAPASYTDHVLSVLA